MLSLVISTPGCAKFSALSSIVGIASIRGDVIISFANIYTKAASQ